MDCILLSTVTPVYHGASYLPDLVRELDVVRKAFEADGFPVRLVESIFVDDNSVDDSAAVLARLEAEYDWVKVITLSRNFGQHPATVAGILHACGDWIATLDEDLQHPPCYLRRLLEEAAVNRHDLVYAAPEKGPHGSLVRDVGSRLYKDLVARLTGNRHVRQFNSYRLVRGPIARAAAAVSSRKTYLDVALCWFTNHVGTVSLPLQDVRYQGGRRSGYTFLGLYRHAKRLILSSEIKVLRVGATVGVVSLFLSALLAAGTVWLKLYRPEAVGVQGWASLVLGILFFGGLNSLLLGIALEYMATVLQHILGQPAFFVVDRKKDELIQLYLKKRDSGCSC